MEKEFNRVRSAKDIAISVILVACGSVLVALPTSVSVNIVGFFMIFAGIILFMILKSGYKLNETGEIFRKSEKFFAQSKKDSIAKSMASGPSDIDLSDENKGNGLRLDTYYNKKSGHVYCRLYEYIPYKYEPCSPFFEYDTTQASKLIR